MGGNYANDTRWPVELCFWRHHLEYLVENESSPKSIS